MINTTQELAAEMLKISKAKNLPQHYATDISIDVWSMVNSKATKFVWLLRTHGSSILPLGQGANPISITYYAAGIGQDTSVKTFLIDYSNCSIQEIPMAKAILLSNQPPCLKANLRPGEVLQRVREVLEDGCRQVLWGVFNPPRSAEQFSLGGWHEYFLENDNQPMAEFLRQAIWVTNSREAG